MRALQGKVSKVVFSDCLKDLLHSSHSSPSNPSPLPLPLLLRRFSSIDASSSTRGASRREDLANNSDLFSPSTEPDDDTYGRKSSSSCGGGSSSNPPNPIPNRPLRGEQRMNRPPPHIPQRKLGLPKTRELIEPPKLLPLTNPRLQKRWFGPRSHEAFRFDAEKGTIPEVVIYTAVVEGFCKARQLNDAVRIFRKMQNNGISPNAFSYTVLIRGMYKGNRLDIAVDFCVEMLEAGHSPNVATLVDLIHEFCKEKGVEEAKNVIVTLKQKGLFV
ncbi:Pentatricopeptide repeat-containing protein [Vitis vinifera]|uniref:Pentatricopeptide repeat-containing protein n=1 Tax=Vitis vinifera TaxID=29760 RepID=A0A438JTF9_VITVI|nr:Pentatricopeptide repeat-containing protein [Vitis vinifera]